MVEPHRPVTTRPRTTPAEAAQRYQEVPYAYQPQSESSIVVNVPRDQQPLVRKPSKVKPSTTRDKPTALL